MKPTLYITVDGGLVSSVSSDNPQAFDGVKVVIVDYDTSGIDRTDKVTLIDGSEEIAYVSEWSVVPTDIHHHTAEECV